MNADYIVKLLETIIAVADSAEKATAIAQRGIAVLKAGKEPTDADWDTLNAETAALRKDLHEDG